LSPFKAYGERSDSSDEEYDDEGDRDKDSKEIEYPEKKAFIYFSSKHESFILSFDKIEDENDWFLVLKALTGVHSCRIPAIVKAKHSFVHQLGYSWFVCSGARDKKAKSSHPYEIFKEGDVGLEDILSSEFDTIRRVSYRSCWNSDYFYVRMCWKEELLHLHSKSFLL
jgi:hypothetical protein